MPCNDNERQQGQLRLKYIFKRVKLNRVKRKPIKALSGGGYIRGRGDFAIQTPSPYKKKQKLRILKKEILRCRSV